MLSIELQTPSGEALTGHNFGDVATGTVSAALAFRIVNTGDVAVSLSAWIEQASTTDGELRVTVAGQLITGTDAATATAIGSDPLAPGASLAAEMRWRNPAGSVGVPVDSGVLRVRAS